MQQVTFITVSMGNPVYQIPVIYPQELSRYIQAHELEDLITSELNEIPKNIQETLMPYAYIIHRHISGCLTHQISFILKDNYSTDYLTEDENYDYLKDTLYRIFWDQQSSPINGPQIAISETMVTIQTLVCE